MSKFHLKKKFYKLKIMNQYDNLTVPEVKIIVPLVDKNAKTITAKWTDNILDGECTINFFTNKIEITYKLKGIEYIDILKYDSDSIISYGKSKTKYIGRFLFKVRKYENKDRGYYTYVIHKKYLPKEKRKKKRKKIMLTSLELAERLQGEINKRESPKRRRLTCSTFRIADSHPSHSDFKNTSS